MSERGTKGYFVISLDFELFWGMFDVVDRKTYAQNLKGVHTVTPKLLQIFTEHGVRATWATVGKLMHENFEQLTLTRPGTLPEYANPALSSYTHFENTDDAEPEYYLAPELVRKIVATPGQELASHTYSHYYCTATQAESDAFLADCQAQVKTFALYKTAPRSLVFPRNQVSEKALREAARSGIKTFRGNETSFLYKKGTEGPLWLRAIRLLDHYVNLSGHNTHVVDQTKSMINVPSSRFLRPYSKALAPFEKLRLRRIKKAMTHAAKNGETFHLWWHPHNFGVNQTENLSFLREVLQHFVDLQDKYGMESRNMADFIPESELHV